MPKIYRSFRALFVRSLTTARLSLSLIALLLISVVASLLPPHQAQAATNSNLNFQARLQTAGGGIVPDGFYNVQFKLYDVSSGGSALWTESHIDTNGVTAGNDFRLRVKNGYLTVNLGSQTAFPGTINWDQDLWITMNVGGTTQTATPTYDGEMTPRIKLTGVPYAFRAGQLAKFNSGTGFTSTLELLAPTGGNQTFQVADQGAAGTYTLLTTAAAAGSYIQNTTSPQTANFNITGSGTIGGGLSVAGHSALGANSAINSGALLYGGTYSNVLSLQETFTNLTSVGKVSGITNYLNLNPAADSTATVIGNNTEIWTQAGNAFNFAGTIGVQLGRLQHNGSGTIVGAVALEGTVVNASAGNITTAYGGSFGIRNTGTGTITNSVGLIISAPANSGGGAVTNNFGLYINDQSAVGSTSSYNIYSLGATSKNYFSGSLGVGVTVPNYKIDVLGQVNASTGFRYNGTAGATGTCGAGQFLRDAVLGGGLITGAVCSSVTGVTTVGAIDTQTKAANGAVIVGTSLYMQTADATSPGLVSTGAQTIAGSKTLTGNATLFKPVTDSTTAFQIQPAASATPVFNADTTNGRIGIGTAAPTALLTVGPNPTTAFNSAELLQLGRTGDAYMTIWDGTARFLLGTTAGLPFIGTQSATDFTLRTNNLERVRVDSAGNVGIGTTPGYKLDVAGDINLSSAQSIRFAGTQVIGAGTNFTNVYGAGSQILGGDANDTILSNYNALGTAIVQSDSFYVQDTIGYHDNLFIDNTGRAVFSARVNSTDAFSVQNSAGVRALSIDTTADSTNLITNGGFELNTTGWAARSGTAGFARTTAQKHGGAASLAFNTDAIGEGVNYPVQLAANTTYSFTGFVKNTTSDTSSFSFGYAANGSTETTYVGTSTIRTAGWRYIDLTFTTPGSVSPSAYFFLKTTSATARSFFADNILVAASSAAPIYREAGVQLNGTITSPAVFRSGDNSTNAFNIQDSSGNDVFRVDTMNGKISLKATNSNSPVLDIEDSNGNTSFELRAGGFGLENTFLGYGSGNTISSGVENTSVGYNALALATTGNANTAVGRYALLSNQGGSWNVAIGSTALESNVSGNGNTAIGENSLDDVTGSYNTGVGNSVLSSVTTGSYNSALGNQAGSTDADGYATLQGISYSTMLGYRAQAQRDDAIILGGAGTDAAYVGIGTSNPTNRLSVSPVMYGAGASFGSGTTASQSTTTVTGSGTNFTFDMVGNEIVFANGTKARITAYVNATTLTVTPSQTVSSQDYRIHYAGLQVTSAGRVGVGLVNPTYNFEVFGYASTYVAKINNDNNSTTADGLLIDLGGITNAARATSNYFIGFASSNSIAGKIQGAASAVTYTTNGADYAEYFRANPSDLPQSGELVHVDTSTTQSVRRSNGNTQQVAVGVVSTSPGFVGNGPICQAEDEDCDANYAKYNALVALSGQVPTKVNTSNGVVMTGDPITVSPTTGQGMKATGASHIVGFALEPLTSEQGTIKVLIRPQYYTPQPSTDLTQQVSSLQSQFDGMGSLLNTGLLNAVGLTVTGDASVGGNLTVGGVTKLNILELKGHFITKGDSPEVVVLDTANLQALQPSVSGNDTAGTITVTVNSDLAADSLIGLTFAHPFEAAPRIVLTPVGKQSAALLPYVDNPTDQGFSLGVSTGLEPGKTYSFNYHIFQ